MSIRSAAQHDAYIARVKAPFLALPDTDENWAAMLEAVAAAEKAWNEQSATDTTNGA